MRARIVKLAKGVLAVLVIVSITLLAFRAWQSQQGVPLQPWHTHVPPELTANELARTDWAGYLARERALFEDVRTHVTEVLEPDVRVPSNRYFSGSPLHPMRFASDWNRSYVLEPAGAPTGAVVLLHGLTDSPYSLRHIAARYREDGFVAVAIACPATARYRPRSRTCNGKHGRRPRASRCARHAGEPARPCLCTSSGSPMAARWQ